jgi:hypothetical protein
MASHQWAILHIDSIGYDSIKQIVPLLPNEPIMACCIIVTVAKYNFAKLACCCAGYEFKSNHRQSGERLSYVMTSSWQSFLRLIGDV